MDITAPLASSDRQRLTFHLKVERVGDCLIWVGGKTRKDWRGYAVYDLRGKTTILHRQLWKDYRGDLDDATQLDHRCRNRACINLDHLEPVSGHENNVIRGEGRAAQNHRKSACPQGHPFDSENTYRDSSGRRHCRECGRERVRKRRALGIRYPSDELPR